MRAAEIASRRLRNSGLGGRPRFGSAAEAVAWHGAMQAQDYGPAKWAIGQRAKGVVDADVDRALADGSIVRTHVLRPTWHFVAREDVRWMLALTGPRIRKGIGPRLRRLGLDAGTLRRSEKIVARSLEDGRLDRQGIGRALERARIDTSGQRLPHILMLCELEAVICSGGLDGKRQTYALFDDRVPKDRRTFDPDAAAIELTRRYLASHGPATVQDLRWWSSLTIADIRRALDSLGGEVVTETVDDVDLWMVASDTKRVNPVRGAELVHVYDEVLVGYTDTRYFGDPRAAQARAAWAERELPIGVVLRGGLVAGHWKRTVERRHVDVDVLLYEKPTPTLRTSLTTAANGLGRFLGLPAKVSSSTIRS